MDPVTLAVISGAKLAMDGIKYFNAQSKEREAARAAEKAFNTMMSTKETDYYAGLQTPTLGYDLATQAGLQSQAAGIQALQGAGAAGVIGGVTALAGQEADRTLQLAAQLQSDQAAVERLKAQGQQGIAAREFNKQLDLQESQLEGARLEQLIQQRRRGEAAAGMTETITGGLTEYLGSKPLYPAGVQYPGIQGKQSITQIATPTTPAGPNPASVSITPTPTPPMGQIPRDNRFGLNNYMDYLLYGNTNNAPMRGPEMYGLGIY